MIQISSCSALSNFLMGHAVRTREACVVASSRGSEHASRPQGFDVQGSRLCSPQLLIWACCVELIPSRLEHLSECDSTALPAVRHRHRRLTCDCRCCSPACPAYSTVGGSGKLSAQLPSKASPASDILHPVYRARCDASACNTLDHILCK